MEAVSKEKKAVKEQVMFSGNELFEIKNAIELHLHSSSSLLGRHVRIMLDNLERLDPILIPLVEAHSKVILKYAKLDGNKKPIRGEGGFEFDDAKKKAAYEKESKTLWEDTKVSVEFSKFPLFIFDEMPFNTEKNNKVFMILKYLVEIE